METISWFTNLEKNVDVHAKIMQQSHISTWKNVGEQLKEVLFI